MSVTRLQWGFGMASLKIQAAFCTHISLGDSGHHLRDGQPPSDTRRDSQRPCSPSPERQVQGTKMPWAANTNPKSKVITANQRLCFT